MPAVGSCTHDMTYEKSLCQAAKHGIVTQTSFTYHSELLSNLPTFSENHAFLAPHHPLKSVLDLLLLQLGRCFQLVAAAQSNLAISAIARRAWQAGCAIPGSIVVNATCSTRAAGRRYTACLAWHTAPLSCAVATASLAGWWRQCHAPVVAGVGVCLAHSLVGRLLTAYSASSTAGASEEVRHT
jgi:hypothetical protein